MITAEEATALVQAAVPALGRSGLTVDEIGPGHVRLRLPLEGNSNHLGTMYAGALFAIAELPGGLLPLTVLAGGLAPIVTEVTIEFVRPARGPVFLTASMDPVQIQALAEVALATGRAEFVLHLQVTDEDGQVVAVSRGTYQLRPG